MDKRTHKVFFSAILFLILAVSIYCLLINPFFWRMGSRLYGTKSDNFATVWELWARNHRETAVTRLVNFPFGKSLRVNLWEFLNLFPAVWLTSITNEVFAFNFVLFLSFILSGFFTYNLVFFLAKKVIPSIICGLTYMILPYYLAMSQFHLSLAQIEVFPLFLLTLVWFLRHPHWYNISWIVLVQFISFAINPHYGLFNFLVLIAFLTVRLFYHPDKGWGKPTLGRLGSTFILVILAAATGLPRYLYPMVSQGSVEVTLGKPFEQLYFYSARVWDYFFPPVQHPLLGKLTSGFIMSHIHNSYIHEQTLYLGWVVILLALLGVRRLWGSHNYEHRFLGLFLPLVALGGFLFSLPPTVSIFGHRLPLPGIFLHYIFPEFRVYARFGIVVATALVVLAGFGIIWVRERFRAKKGVAILIMGLILFEFLNVPPAHFVDLGKIPPVYQWLRQQKEVYAIAEYPLGFPPEKLGENLNLWDVYEYMVWQREHRKPLFNGEPETLLDLAMKLQLSEPNMPNTPPRLYWLGITHLIIHKGKMDRGVLEAIVKNSNLEAIYSDEEAIVFRIVGNTAHFLPREFKYPEWIKVESLSGGEVVLLPLPSAINAEGILLVYGPYIALPEGKFQVEFMLSAEPKEQSAVRLIVTDDNGQSALVEKEFNLSKGLNPIVEFCTAGASNVEFRIYGLRETLRFAGVKVTKIP